MTSGGSGGFALYMDPIQGDYSGNTYQNSIKNLVSGTIIVATSEGSARDVTIEESYDASDLQICMSSDTGGTMNPRYIYEMVVTGTLE
jgi:plastocyanin domain-containing protein